MDLEHGEEGVQTKCTRLIGDHQGDARAELTSSHQFTKKSCEGLGRADLTSLIHLDSHKVPWRINLELLLVHNCALYEISFLGCSDVLRGEQMWICWPPYHFSRF